jgi:TolB-like protein
MLITRERPEEAAAVLEEAVRIREAVLPEGHWLIAETQSALGYSYLLQGRVQEAAPLLRVAVQTLRQKRGEAYPVTRRAQERLDQLERVQREPVAFTG